MAPYLPRLALYGAASTALAGSVVASSFQNAPNFFAAAVAIGRSSGALMILANFALFNVICLGIVFKMVFFGQLRSIEYEHLFERLWLFVTESLLALTIFRRDFSISFVIMYGTLLFLKCFHWITADRIDYMDQVPPPGPSTSFHVRAISVILLLSAMDTLLVAYCLEAISAEGISAKVLFASEFMILLASINGTFARYIIGVLDLRRARGREDAPTWEAKSMYIFYVDLAVDFAKLLTYLAFFTVIFLHYGLPLHILRDVYMTLRSFLSRCGDLIRYRRATRDMDALYPDATPEEMERLGDKTCIICREELVVRSPGESGPAADGGPNDTPKKLVCGHVFHFYCLRSWLERQQSCPTCRRDVLRPTTSATRSAARAAPAAAPAPGPHPQPTNAPPPNPANVLPTAQNPAASPFHVTLDDYFPLRGGAPQTQPTQSSPSAQADPANGPSQPEVDLQTGIWGGPITLGRFFPVPLGAAPRLAPTPSNATVRFNISDRSALSTQNNTSPHSATTLTTVSSSEPPPTSSSITVSSEDEEEIGAIDTSPEDARRQAAEAAMRRLGLAPPSAESAMRRTRMAQARPLSSPDSSYVLPTLDRKGKGRAEGPEETWDDAPKYTPYLSDPMDTERMWTRSSRLSPALSNVLSGEPGSAFPNESGPGISAVEERLRTLRQVDNAIWGLVGELTRLKTKWDEEGSSGTAEVNGMGKSQHQPDRHEERQTDS
ncbi:hypothetical protein BD324DRAFT_580854 [Kockovaella imperatae]|uniref:RING-type E3 ubiquitin transferase n=1 Tax=Kockovaella imperatae TaxID=4999 RepID=A0A1Y1UE42_9TREE|nr:hypothetical protein BD324DRAFT_580854 [Kockovaella imperatae]ORX36259.1 hypothetical protein BD324DRAFT_580854 [Kockovaella imperatae]